MTTTPVAAGITVPAETIEHAAQLMAICKDLLIGGADVVDAELATTLALHDPEVDAEAFTEDLARTSRYLTSQAIRHRPVHTLPSLTCSTIAHDSSTTPTKEVSKQ